MTACWLMTTQDVDRKEVKGAGGRGDQPAGDAGEGRGEETVGGWRRRLSELLAEREGKRLARDRQQEAAAAEGEEAKLLMARLINFSCDWVARVRKRVVEGRTLLESRLREVEEALKGLEETRRGVAWEEARIERLRRRAEEMRRKVNVAGKDTSGMRTES